MRDSSQRRSKRGWGSKGEDAPRAKLCALQVIAAREAYAEGATIHELALRLGVTVSAVRCLLSGATWKHLPGAVAFRRRGDAS